RSSRPSPPATMNEPAPGPIVMVLPAATADESRNRISPGSRFFMRLPQVEFVLAGPVAGLPRSLAIDRLGVLPISEDLSPIPNGLPIFGRREPGGGLERAVERAKRAVAEIERDA